MLGAHPFVLVRLCSFVFVRTRLPISLQLLAKTVPDDKEIKQVSLPELDDEFAAKITGGKDLAELKTMVEQQLGIEKKRQADDAKVNQIVEHFNGLVDFELPEDLVREDDLASDLIVGNRSGRRSLPF